ncbi:MULTISPECIES: hypothetical protein [Sorangium]|uniref:hypothetical protein n=1 Tax=Sorangium TaxID=39643 RepID=UPI00101A1F09|nr:MULTISPECIES: hypothetical protein [Sorangium]
MPRRRLAAPRARGAQAAAVLAALLGLAAPAAAQVPGAPQRPALGSTTAAPAAPGAPPAPATAPPAHAPPAPATAPPAHASAPPAPPGGAQMPIPPGYYLLPPLPPWANPRTIQYEEGDPIPRGYALKTRADRALVGAGLLTFGISYALSFTVAGVATLAEEDFDEFGPLFIPFVGPMIGTVSLDAEGAGMFWLTVDAVAQVGGLLLFAAGLAHEEVYLERQFTASSRNPEHAASPWPAISIGASSAELRWRF